MIRTAQLIVFLLGILWIGSGYPLAQDKTQGMIVVEVLGEAGHQSDVPVRLYTEKGETPVATAKIGAVTTVAPGTYRLELDVLGGQVTRKNILVKTGRTTTVMIGEVAGLQVNAQEKQGQALGLAVEVYDSRGTRLFYDVGAADSAQTLSGSPPFRVVLGNAPGVSVEVNGRTATVPAEAGADGTVQFTSTVPAV